MGNLVFHVEHFLMYDYPKRYDVVIVGAGHAGTEAALSAARLGCSTALLTQNLDTIGQMSCNPAIGGLAKGHMVREIDALGGQMGLNTDATAIQFRMLNATKGPSVRAPRAQADKKAYQLRMKWILESTPNLDLHQGNVSRLLVNNDQTTGIETNLGMRMLAPKVIITTGTFMRGLLHVGLQNQAGGRMGDSPSSLSDHLKELGFSVERFKTGTPCRLHGKSINLKVCDIQSGDEPTPKFSYMAHTIGEDSNEIFTLNPWSSDTFHVEQVPCWITYTNEQTHDIIRDNLNKSPMYSGKIESVGPRYCPSIEDKVVRFANKDRHQLFLEPEGRQTHEFYVNGVSTSLPYEVQLAFMRSVKGLENAMILRPGYAVEYDYCPPTQLHPTLETKLIGGLYFAGQINGTSGYEEAAGQGLLAGINAALAVREEPAFILGRDQAYLGVMIDDLVSKGVTEPYRMFTSRAEHRLLLRQDNADLRLTDDAASKVSGLIDANRLQTVQKKRNQLNKLMTVADKARHDGVPLRKWFRRPENKYAHLPQDLRKQFPEQIWDLAQIDLKYDGYLTRQRDMIARTQKMEHLPLPADLDYTQVNGLKREAQLRLHEIQPRTLGQAGRISGVNPADLSIIAIWMERSRHKAERTEQSS
jgi:tRNA uridine 5-carboxymethylaminomethyl modification enzyme